MNVHKGGNKSRLYKKWKPLERMSSQGFHGGIVDKELRMELSNYNGINSEFRVTIQYHKVACQVFFTGSCNNLFANPKYFDTIALTASCKA